MLGGHARVALTRRLLSQASTRRAAVLGWDVRQDHPIYDMAHWRGGADGMEGRRRFSSQPTSSIAERAIEAIQSAPATAPSTFDLGRIIALSVSEGSGAVAAEAVAQLGSWPSDYAIRLLEFLHQTSGLPYWLTIILSTVVLRGVLSPLSVMTARNAARMTLMKPEMEAITERMKSAPPGDRAMQTKYNRDMQGLFQKYDCQPLRTFMGPLANMAVFVPMFFGLRKMGEYVPDLAEGGAYWFMDLGAADPTYILPGVVTLSFLAVTEIGMDGMKMEAGATMKFVFRVLPIIMLPWTTTMPTGCLIYWCVSNTFSMGQTLVLRNKTMKRRFGIPDIPEAAQAKAENPFKKILDSYEDRKRSKAIAEAEILHGKRPPPPPSSGQNKSQVVTYSEPPRKAAPRPSSGGGNITTLRDIKRGASSSH